ncbi:MAG: glycosyltransferase [Chloroflexi bacterium]|nr:glycosyltransferase [Chloroflexota bacterium]
MQRIAVISVHGCPVARLGEKDTGGMNVYVLQVARSLGAAGLQVDVYTRCHDPSDPQIVSLGANVRVVHILAGPYHEAKGNIFRHLPAFIAGLETFRKAHGLGYDVVHTHYWLSGWVGAQLSRHWGVPHVASFHTLAELKRRARAGEREPARRFSVERRVIERADRIIAFSPHEKEALLRLYGADPAHVRVIPCGVDADVFHPLDREECRTELGLAPDEQVVLYVGRMEPLKGLDLLLRSVARLVEYGEPVRLLMVGGKLREAGYLSHLRRLARTLGISCHIRFVGSVPQVKLPLYYCAADVCVVPSYYESFGLVALEAMACSTPVVASRVGGLPSVVVDGRTGYLVPMHCVESFASRLEMLLSSESLRRAMGKVARETAQRLDWGSVAAQVATVCRELTEGRAPMATAV